MELLKKHGIVDVAPLQGPDVDEYNFILALRRHRYAVPEGFFKELANTLGLPFVQGDRIERKCDLAITLPYTILHDTSPSR